MTVALQQEMVNAINPELGFTVADLSVAEYAEYEDQGGWKRNQMIKKGSDNVKMGAFRETASYCKEGTITTSSDGK